jgi:hypothetical protein
MKKILLLILLICFSAFGTMTVNTWDGSDGSDWSTAANWSANTVPVSSDSVVFNAGAVACSLSEASVCSVLVATSGYTGHFKIPATQKLTIGGKFIYDGGAALTINDSIIKTGDGDFHVGSGVSSLTFNGTLKYMGTGNIDLDEVGRPMFILCGYPNKTATWTGDITIQGISKTLAVMGGTLTLSQTFLAASTIATPLIVTAGSTINGTGQLIVGAGATNLKYILPKLIMTGSTSLWLRNGYALGFIDTFSLSDSIVAPSFLLSSEGTNNNTTLITNNNHVTVAGDFSFGCSNAAGVKCNVTTGSSVIRVGTFGASGASTYNFGTKNLNMGSGLYYCAGSWTGGTALVITAGTSLLTFTGSATLTTNGKTYYDISSTSGVLTLADRLDCNSISVSSTGGFTSNGKIIKTADDQTYSGSGSLRINANDTCGGDIHIGSAHSSGGANNDSLVLTNTGFLDFDLDISAVPFSKIICAATDKTTTITNGATNTMQLVPGAGILQINTTAVQTVGAGCTFARLLIEPASKVKFTSGQTYTVTAYTPDDWDGTAGNLVTITATTPGSAATLTNPAGMSVNYVDVRDNTASNQIISYTTLGNEDGGGNTNWIFTPISITPPLVPAFGTIAGGTTVVISGSGFYTNATVTFGGTAAASYGTRTSTSITAVTPAHAAGVVDVIATNQYGLLDTLNDGFEFIVPFILDTLYRDTTISKNLYLNPIKRYRRHADTMQIDSINGTDTTLNYKRIFRDTIYYDTVNAPADDKPRSTRRGYGY